MANMSPIFEFLGAKESQLGWLWIAAPLTGLLVQPIVGHLSDRTWNRLGRRRPYFLVGAILSTLALMAMPNSGALWMAVGLLWILDASVNITMEPFRAFVADLLPEKQRSLGFSVQTLLIGLGAGIAWACILSMPYAMLAGALPSEKMGTYMGVFNFFIVIPQVVVALGSGWVVAHVLHQHIVNVVFIGGIFLLLAAVMLQRLKLEAHE
jgi:maltose/moltooligosaccharide transporter